MTETCGPHTYDRMDVDLPERLRGSFGHAVPGVEHKVVDPETGATLPPGEVGEICVRGYSLMLGLYKQEREDVFDRDGYYHTGDAGYFDADGVLFFSARLGEMIKTAGANVTPREVEVVIETLPRGGARRSWSGCPIPVRGQNVAAAVVLKRGAAARRRDRARAAARAALELQGAARRGGSRPRKSCRSPTAGRSTRSGSRRCSRSGSPSSRSAHEHGDEMGDRARGRELRRHAVGAPGRPQRSGRATPRQPPSAVRGARGADPTAHDAPRAFPPISTPRCERRSGSARLPKG